MTLYEKLKFERESARKEGQISDLLGIVKDGLLPFDVAARRAEEKYNIKEDAFRKMLEEYQEE